MVYKLVFTFGCHPRMLVLYHFTKLRITVHCVGKKLSLHY